MNVQEHQGGNNSYTMSLSFDNYKNSDAIEIEFIKGIEAIDARIKEIAAARSKEWFKKQMKIEVIDELFRPSVRYSDDWPPLFKCKVPYYSSQFRCDFYDTERRKCEPLSVCSSHCSCICLIQLSSIWFMDKQFGCTWIVKQSQVFPKIEYNTFLIQGGDDDAGAHNDCDMDEHAEPSDYGDEED